MEITLEISCCKFPPAHELRKYWEDNQLSLIKFLAEAHRGVQGFVTDGNGLPVERASLKIKGRDVGFQTTRYGEFWRVLLPGKSARKFGCHFLLTPPINIFVMSLMKMSRRAARSNLRVTLLNSAV